MESRLQVLLIEDDVMFSEMIQRMLLRVPDIDLHTAGSMAAGLQMLNADSFDALLLDLDLPDSFGVETLTVFASKFPEIPVIVLTGMDDETLAMNAVQEGAQDYLLKGEIRKGLLIRAIRYSIDRKIAQEALKRSKDELKQRILERTEALQLANERLKFELDERLALEKIWRRYEFIVNTSKEFMTLVNRQYRYEAVNDSYCMAHNLSREAIVGKTVAEIWGNAHFESVIKKNFDSCFDGKPVSYQGKFQFGALGLVYIDVTYYPYFSLEKEVTHAVVVSRNITAQKEADEKLRSYADRLRGLTRKLVNAQEEERKRLSRELHDEAGQAMTALKISLELIHTDLPESMEDIRQRVAESANLTGMAMEQIRTMAHMLRPPALDALGLNRTIGDYLRNFARKTGLKISYHANWTGDVPGEVEISLYRFLQEALTNVVKHADAKNVQVELTGNESAVALFIEDDGKGFDVPMVMSRESGIGLLGMKERIDLLGGRMEIESGHGEGTLLIARVPFTR